MYKLPRSLHATQILVVLMGLSVLPFSLPAFAASMSIAPTSINYGNRPVNSGVYYYATLKNTGSSTVQISAASITGAFKYSGITPPLSLGVGKSMNILLKFVPKTAGTFTGTFSVSASNATKVSVALSGSASSSTLSVSPTSFSFGNIVVGTTSTKTATLKAGAAPIIILGATTTNPEFTLSNLTLPKTVAAGQSISVSINFKPKSSGSTSTNFVITSNATIPTTNLSASGTGVATTQHTVGLTWAPSKSTVVGYNVYRGTASGGPYTKLNTSAIVTTSFSDRTVKSGSTYYYVTTAVNSSGTESIKSNEVRTVIPTP
ncbi:MAG TPA: choice-of-anchor D domain-containing protein [Terriglobales bacterium]|nr:choice-of-anchor D domain-containing protein [Terriglobales bacterium]